MRSLSFWACFTYPALIGLYFSTILKAANLDANSLRRKACLRKLSGVRLHGQSMVRWCPEFVEMFVTLPTTCRAGKCFRLGTPGSRGFHRERKNTPIACNAHYNSSQENFQQNSFHQSNHKPYLKVEYKPDNGTIDPEVQKRRSYGENGAITQTTYYKIASLY